VVTEVVSAVVVICKHGAYNVAVLLNPGKHSVQVLCPAEEYDPAPHVKQAAEVTAPAIKNYLLYQIMKKMAIEKS
jgi:hypothetical protein